MFDARQTKEEIIDGGMKLHALYVDKCAEIERLRVELKKEYERGFNDHAKFVSRITEIARMKD